MNKVNTYYRVLDENTNKYFRDVYVSERNAVRFLHILNTKKNNPFQTYRVVKFVNNNPVVVKV
mgnify:CR=1 FL=1